MTLLNSDEKIETLNELHLPWAELEAGLAHIKQSPKDHGRLDCIVIRPALDAREVLTECDLSPQLGVHGDNWATRGSTATPDGGPHPKAQVTLMNSRAIALFAQTNERWALAGDQLYVDLDLSEANLQPGQRLSIGSAILEITDKPHRGCVKFSDRFGPAALKFVNSDEGWQLHLRGIYAIVVQAGTIKAGEAIVKC